eukprot:5338010-Karenia_brevis.AAC.1
MATKKNWQRMSSNAVPINGHEQNINGNIGMLFPADNISSAEKKHSAILLEKQWLRLEVAQQFDPKLDIVALDSATCK